MGDRLVIGIGDQQDLRGGESSPIPPVLPLSGGLLDPNIPLLPSSFHRQDARSGRQPVTLQDLVALRSQLHQLHPPPLSPPFPIIPPRGYRQPINWFGFEGYVGQIRLVLTKTGRVMALLDVVQETSYCALPSGPPGRFVWARTWAFDEVAESAATHLSRGDRVVVYGNFASQSKGTGWGFILRLVTTTFHKVLVSQVSRCVKGLPQFFNRFEFEGKVCGTPKLWNEEGSGAEGVSVGQVGIVQAGLIVPAGHNQPGRRKTSPVLVNFRGLGRAARSLTSYEKGERVFLSGVLSTSPVACRKANGKFKAANKSAWPYVELVCSGDVQGSERSRKGRSRGTRSIIPPELEQVLVRL
jgi:hypothetical protein